MGEDGADVSRDGVGVNQRPYLVRLRGGVGGRRLLGTQQFALGRLGAPEDLAGPIVFLASDMAAYVTGAALLVDGGMYVNLQ